MADIALTPVVSRPSRSRSCCCSSKLFSDRRSSVVAVACAPPLRHTHTFREVFAAGAGRLSDLKRSGLGGRAVLSCGRGSAPRPLYVEERKGEGRDGSRRLSRRRNSWRRTGRLTASSAAAEVKVAADDDGFVRSRLAVFLSGGGSNFRALHASALSNTIYGDMIVVVSDKPGCKGCEYAREHDIPVLTFPSSKHAPDGLSAPDLVAALRNYGIDFILLAGYLKLLPLELIRAYPRSILNIHPSLLPSFGGKGYYGMKVHEAVIKSGARFSGATIHFVDENFDTGPILAQRIVPVLDGDTPQDLANRVLKVEHALYSEAVAALCEDRIFWRRDGVPLIRKSWDEAEYL